MRVHRGVVRSYQLVASKSAGVPVDLSELPANSPELEWQMAREHLFFLTFDPYPDSHNWIRLDKRLRQDGRDGLKRHDFICT